MNGRNAPLSPVSLGDSDWPSAYPMDKDDAYANSRGQLASPPNSGGSVPGAMNGFPSGLRNGGGPSPPASIGRSSTATNLYARSESGRSQREESTEALLGEHYVALKRFLSQTSRDGKPTMPANKARDKLQRLTSVQFLELSTDVYDELVRRQTYSRRPPNAPPNAGPPAYLLPEENFHPKRNQARQKLSSLGPPRFRDLATDVFCELERRFPPFSAGDIPRLGSPSSVRAPSRSGTPVNGFQQRGQGRRRPSEADSVRSLRSGFGPGPLGPGGGAGSVPPSPGMPPNGYDRPMQKQSQINTIVPNKSTMVEEDDDAVVSPTNGSAPPNGRAIHDEDEKKRMVDDYESQLRQLRDKISTMETDMKRQKDEADVALNEERTRATAASAEKQGFSDVRRDLETRLTDSQDMAETLQQDIDRMRNDHAAQERQLRAQIDELRQSLAESAKPAVEARDMTGAADSELAKENEELRQALSEQQEVTEEVRRDAEQFLQEMRVLSQQSARNWEKHEELERTIEMLQAEVIEWRNRYARAKTQVRSLRASSMGLPVSDEAGKLVLEQGFLANDGLIKDVHVTKFQIAVDELMHHAHVDGPDKTVDAMKAVVVAVRRITKDVGASGQLDGERAQTLNRLKGRVSASANNLITASKNFSISAGLSPVSLVDAAASNLVAAVVELLRTTKIRTTPADELAEKEEQEEQEEQESGTITPVETSGFFSPRSTDELTTETTLSSATTQSSLPPPPPFQGLGGQRDSADSSAYSPVNSPRESTNHFGGGASSFLGMNKSLAPTNGYVNGGGDRRAEDLKAFLDDQTAIMVQIIQDMVGAIRSDAAPEQITEQIQEIAKIVGNVVAETEASGQGGKSLDKLMGCRERLMEAGDRGETMIKERTGQPVDWRVWTTSLPPIAFEMARETKELAKRIDRVVLGEVGEDFS